MENPEARHLEAGEIAAYVDRRLTSGAAARVEAHLADCDACQREVIEVTRITRVVRERRRWRVFVPAAAAAAVLLLLITPQAADRLRSPHREPAVTTTVAPVPIEPIGGAAAGGMLRWSSVPKSDAYRLTLYDSAGSVLWKAQTADTVAAVPDSVRLVGGRWYYWRVEARTGVGRWAASDLTAFTVAGPGTLR